jgi:inosine-uridine nucleoside N-ribohydrolase
VAAALEREPRIAERARFVGMHGSIAWSHHGDGGPIAEWNVKADPGACRKAFAAPWDKTVTPLDTCGRVRLTGDRYRAVADSHDPLARDVIENYRLWKEASAGSERWADGSSILFDTAAVYLCWADDLLEMERRPLLVDEAGFTRVTEGAPEVNCALAWRNLEAFEELLVERLTSAG